MIAVVSAGAQIQVSAKFFNLPPEFPVKPITYIFFDRAVVAACKRFAELPEVEIQKRISRGLPKAQTSCAYTNSGSQSLQKALIRPVKLGNGIAGRPS